MSIINRKSLLEVGAHFGHRKDKMDPRMKKFVYGIRSGIHIIDLEKTIKLIDESHEKIKEIVSNGGKILFVGTKKQAAEAIKTEALRSNSFYVNTRWLGGTLTNYKTIRKSVEKMKDMESMDLSEGSTLNKKEKSLITKKRDKLSRNLSGIKDMYNLPAAIFVVDVNKDSIAILEAKKLGIPVFGMVDTNVNPKLVDYPIPANDDAIRSVALILKIISDAILLGKEIENSEVIEDVNKTFNSEAVKADVIKSVEKKVEEPKEVKE